MSKLVWICFIIIIRLCASIIPLSLQVTIDMLTLWSLADWFEGKGPSLISGGSPDTKNMNSSKKIMVFLSLS